MKSHLTSVNEPFKTQSILVNDLKYNVLRSAEEKDQPKPTIHFSGANGFPVQVYQQFLKRISNQYSIVAADCRATIANGPIPTRKFDLHHFADDFIGIIEKLHDQPIIAMGHSFGAHMTLLAAIKRPELFQKIILIEPASLPNAALDSIYKHLPRFLVDQLLPMIPKTRARQRLWLNREAFMQRYRHHQTFKHMTEQSFSDYAHYGLRERSDGQLELVFDPRWEAHIFSKVEFVWKNLRKLRLPSLFIRAEHSNLYSHDQFNRENRAMPTTVTPIEIEGTYHLLPLEHPDKCCKAIEAWLAN